MWIMYTVAAAALTAMRSGGARGTHAASDGIFDRYCEMRRGRRERSCAGVNELAANKANQTNQPKQKAPAPRIATPRYVGVSFLWVRVISRNLRSFTQFH